MCNLYKMSKSATEVARFFSASSPSATPNTDTMLFPKGQGLVIVGGTVRSMTWGFPLVLKSKVTGEPLKPKPVNNARSDKLDQFMWRDSFTKRRCLIPLEAWGEAEGQKGSMTRTWLSLPGSELFAVAGIWRDSEEWGACYSMVMADAAGDAAKVHSRMPVLLSPNHYEIWQEGTLEEAKALCVPHAGELQINRTADPWFNPSQARR